MYGCFIRAQIKISTLNKEVILTKLYKYKENSL